MVMDDGVTARLGENHFLMNTTTGGAARVMAWLERWLQTEWPHLKVYLTSVTDHWATRGRRGPNSREVLKTLCTDIDFDDDAFPFMSYRQGTVAGVRARVMRISFSGERGYEVNVGRGRAHVWEAIQAAGAAIRHHALRHRDDARAARREGLHHRRPGHRRLGHAGRSRHGWTWSPRARTSSASALLRAATLRSRTASNSSGCLPTTRRSCSTKGRRFWTNLASTHSAGHVTSSYHSPTLGRSIALALVRRGAQRMGERVIVFMRNRGTVPAIITNSVFFDPASERQNA